MKNHMPKTCAAILLLSMVTAAWLQAAPPASENDQSRLERQIRHELVMLPFYGVFDNLMFKAEGSNVTLMGQVTRPTLKADAERAVMRVEGVQTVDNQIEVLPVSPNDDRIRLATDRYALRAVPPIHIIVKNGHVTLEGVVASEADKNLAGIQANGVSGVFSVTNNLRVEKE